MVTGTGTAALYLGGWSDLGTTPWGRALTVKVVLMLATGAVGAYNWRSLRPRLGTSGATGALLRSARLELLLASLRVEPKQLTQSGYCFRQPTLETTLRHLLGKT